MVVKKEELSAQQKKHIEKHIDKQLSEQLLTKAEFLGHQFKQHVSTAIIAAFSFLIALSWKDLLVHLVEGVFSEEIITEAPYISDLVAAMVITVIAIVGILIVTNWAKKPQVIISETQTK